LREDREDHGRRSPEEVRELREQAAKSATVCADCFEPLANNATVTIHRRTVFIPAIAIPLPLLRPAPYRWLSVTGACTIQSGCAAPTAVAPCSTPLPGSPPPPRDYLPGLRAGQEGRSCGVPKHWNKREAEEDVTRTKREVLPGIALRQKQELIQRRHFAIRA
jgi:hypothetical protein